MFHIFHTRKVKLKFLKVAQLLRDRAKINTQARTRPLAHSAMLSNVMQYVDKERNNPNSHVLTL